MVMTDPRLNIKAKGIYAYFCVWTGSGNSAFPRKESILNHLGITHNTYQRYYKQLIDCNYITVVQRRVKGVMSINDYYLKDNPDVEKLPDTKISDTGKSPDTNFSDTENPDITINSNITINTLLSSSSSSNVLDMSVDELVGYIKTFATVDRLFTEEEIRKLLEIGKIFMTSLCDLCNTVG
jgi:hypothetical protein